MSNYFTTKRKRRKTHLQIPMWIDKERTEYIYNSQSDLVGSRLLPKPDNDLQRIFRDIFAVVDIVAIAKTIKLCFVEETPVLQFEGGNSEPIIVASNIVPDDKSDNYVTNETISPLVPCIVIGLITTVYCGTQMISQSNSKKSKTNEDEPKKKIQLLKQHNKENYENETPMIEEPDNGRKNSFFHKLICCIFITVLLFSSVYLWNTVLGSNKVPEVTKTQEVSVSTQQTQRTTPKYKHTPIQDIKIFDRVVGVNPEISDSLRADIPEPESSTWQVYSFEMLKSGGERSWITLARHVDWFILIGANQNDTVYLELPEMGVVGNARVCSRYPCPPLIDQPGSIVTGVFRHEASVGTQILTIAFSDGSIISGTTDNHPFWSEEKQEFIEAKELVVGSVVRTAYGTAIVTKITNRNAKPAEILYNLEIHGEHVYQIARNGILVHNMCASVINESNISNKLKYIFGQASGSPHNINRSTDMLRQLERIGLSDIPANRKYIRDHLISVHNDPNNIIKNEGGCQLRESLLMGPNGGVKLQTVWEDSKLITVFVLGGH